jgi:hypothetical protein
MNHPPFYKQIDKQAALRSALIGAALSLIIIFAIPPLLINPILNGLKSSAVKQVKSGSLYIESLSYNLFTGKLSAENIFYNGANGSLDSISVNVYNAALKNINWLKYAYGGGISAGSLTLDDPNIEMALMQNQRNKPVNKGFSAIGVLLQEDVSASSSLPEELRNISIGRFEINSGRIIYNAEGSVDSIGEFYLKAKDIEVNEGEYPKLSSASFILRDVSKTFSKGYKLNIGLVQYVDREKLFEAENVKYFSDLSDKEYFAQLTSREDKLDFEAEKISAKLGGVQIAEKPSLVVEMIKLQKPKVHITTPKYIPLPKNSPKEPMPGEALHNLPFGIKVDKLYGVGGVILLHELYKPDGKYAELIFDDLELEAEGISGRYFNNTTPARLKIKAFLQGKGEMQLDLTMPLQASGFGYKAKGSLTQMDLRELNPYLEYAEYIQITAGKADSVIYEINAQEGYAECDATPFYSGVKIKSLDEDTGKDSGLDEKAASFIANNFVLRESNPDKKEGLKRSRMRKTFSPDETFFERLWLPLKKSLGDVVGFEE